MKYSFPLLFVLLSILHLQAQTVLIKDSSNHKTYRGSSSSGEATVNMYTYNSDCLLSDKNSDGYYDVRYHYTYKLDKKISQTFIDTFTGSGTKVGSSRLTYRYDTSRKDVVILTEVLENNTYVNSTLESDLYNQKNLLSRKFTFTWDAAKARFVKSALDSTVYTNTNQISHVFRYQWNGAGVKKLAFQSDTLYNRNGTVDSTADYNYIDFEVRAISASKYRYTLYDTLKQRYQIVKTYSESYNPGAWNVVNTSTLRHDSANYVSRDTIYNTSYEKVTEYITHIYNTDGTPASVYTYDDYPNNGYMDQSFYTQYTYATCSPMATASLARTVLPKSLAANPTAVSVSPNPVRSLLQIALALSAKAGSAIRIYDAGGRLVIQQSVPAGVLSLRVDCSRLGRGMYILKYGDETQKIIKE